MKLKDYFKKKEEIFSKKGHVLDRLKYKSEPVPFVGNYAKHDLDSIVYAYSVGFKDLYKKYLERAVTWLREGIEKQEQFGEFNFHQYELTSSLALASWLNTGTNDINLWKDSLKWQEALYGEADYSKKMGRDDKEIFAVSILHYVQAQEYEKAIGLYQSAKGDKPFKLNSSMSGYRCFC